MSICLAVIHYSVKRGLLDRTGIISRLNNNNNDKVTVIDK